MSKKTFYKLLFLYLTVGEGIYNDFEPIYDEEVNDCLMKLYFSMLTTDTIESDKLYNDFEDKYNKLNDEQKELAKQDIAKILDIEYKPKVKKKER